MKEKFGISGSTLKLFAIVSMFIDHVGAGILGRYLPRHGISVVSWMQTDLIRQFFGGGNPWLSLYFVMRMFGRLAFPIFCFLLVEGVQHTKSRWNYAGRLFVFALLSEIPFDLVFRGRWLEFGYQNVMFTLLIGLLCIMAYESVLEKWQGHLWLTMFGLLCILFLGMRAADFLHTDYSSMGVLAILLLYLSREKKWHQIIVGCLVFAWEIVAPLAFVPIAFYNGKRGFRMKYFFYAFYPVHLLIIYGLCVLLALA